MRSMKRTRYYCDHCSKSGGSGPAMLKHEAGCTSNPARVCGMCRVACEEQAPMADLLQAFSACGFPALRELANDCPACILSVLRRANADIGPDDPNGPFVFVADDGRASFSFKTAAQEFWARVNAEQQPFQGYY